LLNKFINFLNYKQANVILSAIEDQISDDPLKSIFVTNVNPYYSSLKLMYLLNNIKSAIPITHLRIDQIACTIEEKLIAIADEQTQFTVSVEDQMKISYID